MLKNIMTKWTFFWKLNTELWSIKVPEFNWGKSFIQTQRGAAVDTNGVSIMCCHTAYLTKWHNGILNFKPALIFTWKLLLCIQYISDSHVTSQLQVLRGYDQIFSSLPSYNTYKLCTVKQLLWAVIISHLQSSEFCRVSVRIMAGSGKTTVY